MSRSLVFLMAAVIGGLIQPAFAQSDRIVTGPQRGTYIAIGEDLVKYVAEPAGLHFTAAATRGSTENVQQLSADPGARLGLVQSDVYQAFLDQAAQGNAAAAAMVTPLRVVLPLYLEEIYFVVRADSDMRWIEDIRDKRISVGAAGSGTALSATTVYRMMFATGITEKNAFFYSNADALRQLVDERSVDVAVIVGGQPSPLFASMRPEARKYIRLLKLAPDSLARRATADTYPLSVVRASSYPAWLTEDIPTLSVRALLVAHASRTNADRDLLARFATSLCDHFDRLLELGHAKWRDVTLAQPPLGAGWRYHPATSATLSHCRLHQKPKLTPEEPAPGHVVQETRSLTTPAGAGTRTH